MLCHDFRLLDKSMPDFKECAETHDSFISSQSHVAMLTARMKNELLKELQVKSAGRFSKSSRKLGEGGRPSKTPRTIAQVEEGEGSEAPGGSSSQSKGGKASKAGKKRKQGASAWPDMPQLNKEEYTSFRKEVQESFPDSCIFYLASRCSKGDGCQREHTVPDGYAAIKAKYNRGE